MKIRTDFVSNSSSSSYIIAVISKYTPIMVAQDVAERTFGDDFTETAEFFESKTVLTAIELQYSSLNSKLNTWICNFIPVGICIDDEEIDKWFDADGEVRNDLDILEVIPKLSWYSDDGVSENEDIVYRRRLMGKVTIKTLKFTKWLHDKLIEAYGVDHSGYYLDSSISAEDQLDIYENNLSKGKQLYLTRFSYSGDAMRYGHIYIAETDGWKRGIRQRMLEDSISVKDAWFVES